MNKFNYFKKVKFLVVYTFFYLISAELAIGQSLSSQILLNLENGLNKRDFGVIQKYFVAFHF